MIITRTPVRISLFGGGSDYPDWFKEHGGICLNATIDKYSYLTVRKLPPFFEHKNRIVYSTIETTQTVEEIKHPSVRECLKYMGMSGLEIHHDGDLPARSGLGTSSSFTVGLLHALHLLNHEDIDKLDIAYEAIYVEQDLIKEKVGCQDQISCAMGGLNLMRFGNKTEVTRLNVPKDLESHLLLVFTGFPHLASEIASTYNFSKEYELNKIMSLAETAVKDLKRGDITAFGELLNESWQFKKSLSDKISSPYIDYLYDRALKAGALGGKILGAGGGGFMLLFVKPENRMKVIEAMGNLLVVPFKFETGGTQAIFNGGEC
jgi:D-glycero-alpha-D-manno-heptose-7-phosphate kinase